ncbi:hypothetical protein SLEP1_g24718 [Rubroshorea leprosula]|uniref:Uncharacterized protein n=1 Tax=Rubroshorea leprosula TaxID=152421 RepID=A0AAV5JGG2_9ROSI|nr:hypothetical protein SLEP1_g24718 [Rubroshorea leprosula]
MSDLDSGPHDRLALVLAKKKSPAHSKGENEPIIPPPLSPILGEHSFVNPTFNKDSESGDDVAQSSDSLMKAVSEQISIMRRTQLKSESRAQQRSQERPRETSEAFLARFQKAKLKCRVALPKQEFVKLAQNGLDIELRKKFEGMEFCDFFELSYKDKIDKGILRFLDKAKETMEVDADPFPSMYVGVNAVDLRSIARDRNQPYHRRRLVVDDLRWVIEEARAQVGLKAKFDVSDKVKNSSDVICFGEFSVNLSCLVITLPLVFQAREQSEFVVCHQTDLTKEKEVIEIPTKEDGGMDSADKIIFEKPEERMARHIRPLYIHAHLDGMPINRVLVDNGAAVNVLPTCILHKIGKFLGDLMEIEVTISDFTGGINRLRGILPVELTIGNKTLMCAFFVVDTTATYNALLGRGWIHSNWCVPSTLHQKLIFWNGGRTEVMTADDNPFVANTNVVEARYCDEDIGTCRFFWMDRYGRPSGVTACTRSAMDKQTVKEVLMNYFGLQQLSEVVYEGEEEDLKDQITLEELDLALAKLDDLKIEVQDPLEEVNLEWQAENLCRLQKSESSNTKDEYPMPIADLLVDGAARHRIVLFMDDAIKYILSRPLLRDKIGKWVLALSEFYLKYMPQKAVKGQVLADFLADHPRLEVEAVRKKLDFNCTNNQAEYEALIIGLEVLVELKVPMIEIIVQLLEEFDDVILRHVTRDLNTEANEMAQIAPGLKISEGVMSRIVVVEKQILSSIHMRDMDSFGHRSLKDCISYAKGCKAYQIHGPPQKVPTSKLHPIIKPWPFRGWAIVLYL